MIFVFFSRDLQLYKLVFQDDALPDGTELAYFVHGQVVKMSTYILLFWFKEMFMLLFIKIKCIKQLTYFFFLWKQRFSSEAPCCDMYLFSDYLSSTEMHRRL